MTLQILRSLVSVPLPLYQKLWLRLPAAPLPREEVLGLTTDAGLLGTMKRICDGGYALGVTAAVILATMAGRKGVELQAQRVGGLGNPKAIVPAPRLEGQ